MTSRFAAATAAVASTLLWSVATHAGQPCEVVPMPCTFEAVPFRITVVEAESRRPLADVHALAEWQVHGPGGRLNGPLMVLDAMSDSDGVLKFPGWGPIEGPWDGIGIGRDPVITLFKSGYKTDFLNKGYRGPARERERVRRATHDGRTYPLERFVGTPEEWMVELRRVWHGVATPRSEERTLRFRAQYLRRLELVAAERDKFPPVELQPGKFAWHLDRELTFLREGHR